MRKLVAFILVIAMVSVCGTSAAAAEVTSQIQFEKRYEIASQVYASNTEFTGVKVSPHGVYAMEIQTPYGPALQPVGRTDVGINGSFEYQCFMMNDKVPAEVKEAIRSEYELAAKVGNETLSATYFSPVLLEANAVSTNATEDQMIFEYKDTYMRNDMVFYTGINTNYVDISTGANTRYVIDTISSVALIGLGFVSSPVVTVGLTAVSIGQFFASIHTDFVATGSFSDFCMARLIYDKAEQFTYRMKNNEWKLGVISERVTITNIATETYLYSSVTNSGETAKSDKTVNIRMETENFFSPWETAYQNYGIYFVEELVSWQMGGRTFYF